MIAGASSLIAALLPEMSMAQQRAVAPEDVPAASVAATRLSKDSNAAAIDRQGRVVTGLQMASSRLGRPIPYAIYLPKEHSVVGSERVAKSERHFPVLYLLHGYGDNEQAWLKLGGIDATLDRLIGGGVLQPLIVVMPMAGNSWYVDDARDNGFGPVFSALVGDLVAGIDQQYATLACREGRAIGGLSMGGFGAALAGVTQSF